MLAADEVAHLQDDLPPLVLGPGRQVDGLLVALAGVVGDPHADPAHVLGPDPEPELLDIGQPQRLKLFPTANVGSAAAEIGVEPGGGLTAPRSGRVAGQRPLGAGELLAADELPPRWLGLEVVDRQRLPGEGWIGAARGEAKSEGEDQARRAPTHGDDSGLGATPQAGIAPS